MASYLKYSLFYTLLFFTPTPQALLPPKYQETLLCLPGFCLARRETVLFGSKGSQYKCQYERIFYDKLIYSQVHELPSFMDALVWTTQSGESLLNTLKDNGFHEQRCNVLIKHDLSNLRVPHVLDRTKTSIYT
jgi:hypothetical protein